MSLDFRARGADGPWGDPGRDHGSSMEGYFWRFTDRRAGRVVIALCGVNRAADGGRWATVALGEWPSGFLAQAAIPDANADPHRLGAFAGRAFHATEDELRVDLGEHAKLHIRLHDVVGWPRARPFGGSGFAQLIPGLIGYWHPHVLGAHVEGTARLGDAEVSLRDADAYAEKNWGETFPEDWWWGQAQGFEDRDVCVAFGGAVLTTRGLRRPVTTLVVRLGRRIVRLDPLLDDVRTRVGYCTWEVRGRSRAGRWAIDIDGYADPHTAHLLPVPLPAERRQVTGSLEHLGGHLRLRVRRGGRTVFEGTSDLACLEHGGIPRAQAEERRRAREAAAA